MESSENELVEVSDGMHKMTATRALWHALATVGAGVAIVCLFAVFFLKSDTEAWLIFLVIVLVPALLLLPVVYHNYMKGPKRRRFTRRQNLAFAIMFGVL